MTGWPTHEESDDLDPTVALVGEIEEPVDEHPEAAEATGDPVADETESVKVWVDDDGRVAKIYLSNRWRERAKEPLVDRFRQAVYTAQARVSTPVPLPSSALPGRAPGAEAPLDTVVRRLMELREKRRELTKKPTDQVRRAEWTGTVGRGQAADGKVEVVLDREQLTAELLIDEQWAQTARTEQITSAVLQAHHAAYAAHVPGEFIPGEFGELAQEAAALANELVSPSN